MQHKFFVVIVLIVIILTGCGTTPAPTSESTELSPTVTMLPTKTLVPLTSTWTPVPTITVTDTPLPTETSVPTLTPTNTALATPNLLYGSSDYEKRDDWATLKLDNNTDQEISIKIGGPGFYTYLIFKIDTIVEVPWGDFWYEAYIGQKGPLGGGFSITNSDKHTLVFEGNKIRFLVP